MMTPVYEPFIGLTYDGVHSSTLGLYRVSDGSRYNEDLLPSFSEQTIERTGADGMYFFGGNYRQKIWSIEFAFDHVTKKQLLDIKKVFGKGMEKPLKLIFDEDRDYTDFNLTLDSININPLMIPPVQKYYFAKVSQPPQLKTLCFEEEDEYGKIIDVYKGELTVEFTSYSSFGYGKTRYFRWEDKDESIFTISENTLPLNLGDREVFPVIICYRHSNSAELPLEYINIAIEDLSGTLDNSSIDSNGQIIQGTDFFSKKALVLQNIPVSANTYGIVIDGEKSIVTELTNDFFVENNYFEINNDYLIEDEKKWKQKIYDNGDELIYRTNTIIHNNKISAGTFFSISPNTYTAYRLIFSGEKNSNWRKIMLLKERKY